MRDLVKTLLELQGLEILRQESQIVHKGKQPIELEETERQIAELRQGVPEVHLKRYDGHRRVGLGVVEESGGACRGCFLNIPVGDLNRMRRDQIPRICPNCGRFLLLSES